MHAVLSDVSSASGRPASRTASMAAMQQYLEDSDMARSNFFGIGEPSSFALRSTIEPATRLLNPRLSHSGMARSPLAPLCRAFTTCVYSCPKHETRPTPVIATREEAMPQATSRPRASPLAVFDCLEKVADRLNAAEFVIVYAYVQLVLELRRQCD